MGLAAEEPVLDLKHQKPRRHTGAMPNALREDDEA